MLIEKSMDHQISIEYFNNFGFSNNFTLNWGLSSPTIIIRKPAIILMSTAFTRDFLCGGAAGAASGILVGPIEYLKVVTQTTLPSELQSTLRSPKTYHNMLKAMIPFSSVFAAVCALEFSVNERIRSIYGKACGISASALTGASFLTAADHLMLRRQKGQSAVHALQNLFRTKGNALWTGFTPMVAREAIFISSVMYLGPWLGRRLQESSQGSNSLLWTSLGRVIMGVMTTLLSQPFDVLARQMQMNLYQSGDSGKGFNLFSFLKNAQGDFRLKWENTSRINHPLFCGAVPRMGLSTMGGVLAGGLFDVFHSKALLWISHEIEA